MRVLIIGGTGRVGSAALSACLAKNHTVTALLRTPSKLPLELRHDPRIHLLKGDPTSHSTLVSAITDADAIIQATGGSPSSSHTSPAESDAVTRCIISAAREVQKSRSTLRMLDGGGGVAAAKGRNRDPIRLWVLSGQALKDYAPGGRRRGWEGEMIAIHPRHYKNYAFLQAEARDVDWRLMGPGRVEMGEVRVLLYECR